ncbi:MAG: DUF1549 domain-containing protein [Planctomycetaceae bacterium]|jgi:hypothetical protein|nr:DUF1549 domain-containing protein [Planctomycetaceae bacterium]MBT6158081.1 DUF1549 domain-containing protein [Planctomycetaceae bacterium]MBT6486479.1 DUF1549 domain-containing protein [Planctomycetaceae bacterium]MBT6495802.1 DUF1549 domain-containing protein [Planctomycetaceae bacterium]
MKLVHTFLLPTIALSALLHGSTEVIADDRADLEFFEKRIRPVLVGQCYSCHSQAAAKVKKLKGGLFLDSREGLLKGGDSGPAIEPGKPDDSLLLSAMRYDDFEMPPKGRLPKQVIADFVKWIKVGAPDPRKLSGSKTVGGIDLEKGRRHWAYQPLRTSAEPKVRDTAWPTNAIDRFILVRLEANSLRPSTDAKPDVLIRRLYYDLTGLPPTPEEVDEFVADSSPMAYRQLVERLLASPRFGERWGRHWLDVVRYGESNTLRGTVFSQAWRYRDYVIDAFNNDMPFNQFIIEQIAGDLLPSDSWQQRRRQLIATGVLSMGNNNFENQDKSELRMDAVDEQLDVIGRAFLGQTITCARCHDHKFDPIPTRDYYALAGILRNTETLKHSNVSRWIDVPLPAEPQVEEAIRQQESVLKKLQQQIVAVKKSLGPAAKQVAGDKAVSLDLLPGIVIDNTKAVAKGQWSASTSSPRFVAAGYLHDGNTGKGQRSVTFTTKLPSDEKYEVRVSYSPGGNRASNTPVTITSADGQKTIRVNQQKRPPIDNLFISLGTFSFRRDEPARVVFDNAGTDGHVIVDAVQFLGVSDATKIAKKAEKKPPVDKKQKARVAALNAELKTLEAELKKAQAALTPRELAMSVLEESEIGNTHIHIRGNVHNLGGEVPRGFLQVASTEAVAKFSDGESGRRQLGEWLASDANPLTARVTVNRLWHWLYGAGLVRTTDNFGTVGEKPSHPELLEYLAVQFQRDGWSVKSLLRQMVLSRTYRMSSRTKQPIRVESPPKTVDGNAPMAVIDVENRLLWRMNRRRLEAESIRDTMLVVSGKLELKMHGPTFPSKQKADYDFHYTGMRRGVYAPVFRNSLPDLFEVFDFANPSIVVGSRSVSTVASQALFMMNNEFVIEQSQHAAERSWRESPKAEDRTRIERAYRLALGRRPTAAEVKLAHEFVSSAEETTRIEIWGELYQVLFASLDFRYID